MDVGAGPGYATIDLAEIVGAKVGRRRRTFRALRTSTRGSLPRERARKCPVSLRRLMTASGRDGLDAAWCRWVACFVRLPDTLVANIAAALLRGGVAIFHEYVTTNVGGSLRVGPRSSRSSPK